MMFPKTKRVKLKPRELKKLHQAIFDRDNSKCVVCGHFVSDKEKFHHEPCGTDKSDEIEKGVVLCLECHIKRHSDKKESIVIKKKIKDYLKSIYGG